MADQDLKPYVFIQKTSNGFEDAAWIARLMEEQGISIFSIVPWEEELYVCGKFTATQMKAELIGRDLRLALEEWGISSEDV